MTHSSKRIVAAILALLVIGSAVWYIFIYDRDFARDLLLSQARYLDSNGKSDVATWFYDQAYVFADNDEDVAIELANQYKASGNYTKAEYTLTRAISDGPSVKLYTALCATYVEQDKLMDAVAILDKISDPAIKAELDSLRPAVPVLSMAPGYYTEYITLEMTAEGSRLYVSQDGEYPSVNEDAYAGPIELPQGETTIYTVTIADNGLVSPLGIHGYTIGGVIEAVTFADPVIEKQVREDLGFDEDTVIYTDDLWAITAFSVPYDAETYTDLSKMIYLKDLTILGGISEELGCLSSLQELESLMITECEPSKEVLTAIAAMPKLRHLTLAHCGLSDISPLVAAQNLEYLDLSYNSIGDVSPISTLPKLDTLYLSHNALTDLTVLNGLSNLRVLNVSYNSLTTVAPICANTTLTELHAGNNMIASLGALNNLTGLTTLDLGNNNLTDVSVLGNCPELTVVNVSNNKLTDITALSPLMKIQSFNCSYNAITSLPDWSAAASLVILDASYNQISDLTPLRQMMNLNVLNMDYNPELSDITPIAYCPVLLEVNLFGTKVIDVDILTQQSIIVHYNPTEVEVEITDDEGEETDPTEDDPEEDSEYDY